MGKFKDRDIMIKDVILQLAPVASQTGIALRYDCPFCEHKKTLSISNENGNILYFCFSASCNVKGKISDRKELNFTRHEDKSPLPIPLDIRGFVPLARNDKALEMVLKRNSYEAYRKGRADIQYDVRQDRVVFMIREGDKLIDAVGRKLKENNKRPKWFRYARSRHPFVCPTKTDSTMAVLVEDCFSACAVSELHHGIALMGTNLPNEYLTTLKNYSRIVVALDRDASKKAIELTKHLKLVVPASLVFLKKDIKNMKLEEIKEIL